MGLPRTDVCTQSTQDSSVHTLPLISCFMRSRQQAPLWKSHQERGCENGADCIALN